VGLVVFAYAPATENNWIWDDDDYVTENPLLGVPDGLFRIWFGFHFEGEDPAVLLCELPQYYPLVFSTFYFEHAIWGLDPAGYHWTNVLLHAANAILLFVLLRRLGLSLMTAWLAAALFGVHPVTVESVAWVSERKNVLSGFFYFLSFLTYLRFDKTGGRVCYFGSLLLFVCALLSKSVTATLPAVILLALYLRRPPVTVRHFFSVLPFLVLGFLSGCFTAYIERVHVGAEGAEWGFSFVERCLIASRAVCFYAAKIVAPLNLTFIYERWNIDSAAVAQYIFPAILAVAFFAAFKLRKRVGRLPLFGLSFFVVTLLPALGFVDFYPQIYSFVADHFQYLGCIGVLILVAAAVDRLVRFLPTPEGRWTVWGAAGLLILLALCALSRSHCRIFKDQETLWTDTIAGNENDFIGNNNLGLLRLEQGRIDDARELFLAAVGNSPTWEKPWQNLASLYLAQRRFKAAEPICRKLLELKPEWGGSHHTMGQLLRGLGRYEEAEEEFVEAIRLSPLDVKPSGAIAAMAAEEGRLDVAIGHYERIARLEPGWVTPHTKIAGILLEQGRPAEAVSRLRRALALSPSSSATLNDLARILATSPVDSLRDGVEAVRLAGEACRIVGFRNPYYLATLAAACAEAGDFERAVGYQRQLAATAPPGQKETHQRILALYESGKPLRE
jgi:protein O-mannosyl-transferase